MDVHVIQSYLQHDTHYNTHFLDIEIKLFYSVIEIVGDVGILQYELYCIFCSLRSSPNYQFISLDGLIRTMPVLDVFKKSDREIINGNGYPPTPIDTRFGDETPSGIYFS